MKSSQLAWIMFSVGVLGAALLAVSLYVWSNIDQDLFGDRSGLVGFLSLLFLGAFFSGFWQAWFGLFASWTGRVLVKEGFAGSGRGALLGVAGLVFLVAMVIVVVLAGAAGSIKGTTLGVSAALVAQVVLLGLQGRWVANYSWRIREDGLLSE